ncbi:hypothetical protein QCA50_000865 [Cerrena zonata]|uniref:Uncharacterized protein n=1 Tax=Cerrena zonata TaxID=2478898 RepID=A0AAW0GVL1_9APHY
MPPQSSRAIAHSDSDEPLNVLPKQPTRRRGAAPVAQSSRPSASLPGGRKPVRSPRSSSGRPTKQSKSGPSATESEDNAESDARSMFKLPPLPQRTRTGQSSTSVPAVDPKPKVRRYRNVTPSTPATDANDDSHRMPPPPLPSHSSLSPTPLPHRSGVPDLEMELQDAPLITSSPSSPKTPNSHHHITSGQRPSTSSSMSPPRLRRAASDSEAILSSQGHETSPAQRQDADIAQEWLTWCISADAACVAINRLEELTSL